MNIVNDKVVSYVDEFYKPLNNTLKVLREKSEEIGIPIILRDTEIFMKPILDTIKPKKILEVGTATGYSSAFMATFVPDCHITTIEKDERHHKEARENLEKMGFSNRIKVIGEDAKVALSQLIVEMEENNLDKFDFIFIDGGKSHYREFWDKSIKMSKKGTIIVCDNIFLKASVVDDSYDKTGRFKTSIRNMREFLHYINNLESVDTSILSIGDGVSLSYVK